MDGRIGDVLARIKDEYGDAVFFNHVMVKNLLGDLAPGYPKERIHIVQFLENNGFFQLKHAEKTFPITRQRLISHYADTYAVDVSVAAWVVDVFAALLGYGETKPGASFEKAAPPPPAEKLAPLVRPTLTPTAEPVRPLPPFASRMAADVHSAAVLRDGRVAAQGPNEDGQCNIWWWRDVVAVAAGTHFTVGLQQGGTVLAAGRNDYGQCEVKHLTGIRQISAGTRHMAALRADGSVAAVGDNASGACKVHNWRHITRVIAGCRCTFGIKKDGRLLACGHGFKDPPQARDVKDVAHALPGWAVALDTKGTVTPLEGGDAARAALSKWRGLTQIAAAPDYIAGLFADGTVRLLVYFWPATGIECAPNDWRGITAIAAGRYHLLGLRKDGRVEAAMLHPNAAYNKGQCNVGDWVI